MGRSPTTGKLLLIAVCCTLYL